MEFYIVSQNKQTITKIGTLNIREHNEQYIIVNQEEYIMGFYDSQERCEEIMKDILQELKKSNTINIKKSSDTFNYEVTGSNNIYYMPKE